MKNATDAVFDNWHPISALADVPAAGAADAQTLLLGVGLNYGRGSDGIIRVIRGDDGAAVPLLMRHGFLWASLGDPPPDVFPIPELDESDRTFVSAGPVGVAVSAPRAVENFLDMGHFPFVHTGILGEEPHTEVKEYEVKLSVERDEILATRCRFYQPRATLASSGGADVDYVYRVPHPYCAVLYKSAAGTAGRMDMVALLAQPMTEESIRAHMLLSVIDETNSRTALRRFQLMIFGQDKPILENQYPKKLPLDPRAETPIRADISAIAYRRWLGQKGVTYGVIPQSAN